MNRTKKFLTDGMIVAICAVFMRTVVVMWNGYVSKIVGAEAMGLLSLVMSVYGFAVTFALSGIGLGVTRCVSEAISVLDYGRAKGALCASLLYAVFFGTIASVTVFTFSEFISVNLLCDMRCIKGVRIFSLSMLPLSVSAVFGGYFNAVRRVYKSAAASISEQFVRMGACVLLFSLFLSDGVEGAVVSIVLGSTVAECFSCLMSAMLCAFDVILHNKGKNQGKFIVSEGKKVCLISLPIALSTYLRSALTTVEHILIPRCLRKNGLEQGAALSAYGMLGSMVIPLVLYPASLTASFASLLVPELSGAKAKGEWGHIKRAAAKAIYTTLAFSTFVSVVMMCYGGEFGRVMYNSQEAGYYIKLLSPIIPIMYLDTVVDSMLKGLGYQVYTMVVNIIDATISVIGVLIFIPSLGILGYVVLITVSEIINAGASMFKLVKVVKLDLSVVKLVVIPVSFSVLSCMIVRFVFSAVTYVSDETAKGLFVHITAALGVYLIMTKIAIDILSHLKNEKISVQKRADPSF